MNRTPAGLWPIVSRLAGAGGWPPHHDDEIASFFKVANYQNLFPLLMADTDVPPDIEAAKSRFRALDALYRKRYELSRDAVLELQRVLGSDAFLLFKGSDYRHRLYARPELRQMQDVDIHIPSTEMSAAMARLAAAGYQRAYFVRGASLAPGHHEMSVVVKGVHVEIHRAFVQRVRNGIDYQSMWRRREWFERDGVRGYRLAPADAVLGHAVSLSVDEFSPELNRYVDFYLLLQLYADQLPECVARAKAWDVQRPLFGALHVTSTLFPSARTTPVTRAIDELLDKRTRRFLGERVLPDPATERSGHASGRRVQLWRKFWLIDQFWRRLAFLAYQAYATVIGSAIEWRGRRSGLIGPGWYGSTQDRTK